MAKRKPAPPAARPRRPGPRRPSEDLWLYGVHAVLAAIANPQRPCRRLLVAAAEGDIPQRVAAAAARAGRPPPPVEAVGRRDIEAVLPPAAVHQGLALLTAPLPAPTLDEAIAAAGDGEARIVVLDQATDPRNVGAVLRSAAAFAAAAVVMQERHAPPVTGVLAKAASGALETVPLVRAVNLARALDGLKRSGFWCLGLDAAAPRTLADTRPPGRAALVLGAEGAGLRRLTREACDLLVRIPVAPPVDSLNVSATAAIALYELTRDG